MRMSQLGERCKHGLYCNCIICNFENEIERLKMENVSLKLQLMEKVLPKAIDPTESPSEAEAV
jgi:hypothetical protein